MKNGLEPLIDLDPGIVLLGTDDCCVAVTPRFQGRIFCALNGALIHRLVPDLLRAPAGGPFKNLGGNSLWPAPEGGPFAFNYPPGGGAWQVQSGIADQPAVIVARGAESVHVAKDVTLVNRRGMPVPFRWERSVRFADRNSWPTPGALPHLGYASDDRFTPAAAVSSRDALLAPWSLEQFPGGDGVVAFARVEHAASAINTDFYGVPGRQPRAGNGYCSIELGGETKWQIGVTVVSRPILLGALDRKRGLLLLRRARPQVGRYFNIADNDQPGGPWTAADLYSVFCGGPDGFFELETIAPMQTDAAGNLAPCTLSSETLIVQGACSELEAYLEAHWRIVL